MKTYVTYGFFMAMGFLLLSLAFFFLGYHSDATKFSSIQLISNCLLPAIAIVVIVLGTKARRADVPLSEPFGYGRAFLAGFLITLFACLFGLVTNYLYFHVINPGMTDVMIQMQVDKLEAKGLTGDQLDRAEKMTRSMMGNPLIIAVFGFLGGLFWGTIISLITAIFLKRKHVETTVTV
jgi:MFS family permease